MLSVPVERAKLLRVEGRHTWTVQTSDDGWAVTDPGAGKAITRTVTGLLRKLDGLQAQRVLAEAPDDLRDYGLDKPQLVVTVTVAPAASDTDEATDDEPTTHTLLLGNVRQDSICATLKDRPTVFLLPKSMLDSLNPGLDEVRSDDLLEFDPEAIAAITVERAGGKTLKLVRDGETWTIRAPLSGPAETAAVEDLLRKASSLQADDWLTLAGDFEIDSPMATLTMEPEDETLAAVTLTIGGKSPGEPRNVVRSSQAPAPALVTLAKLEPLLAGAEAYWPTQLTEIGPDERIAAMTLNRPDETVQLKRLAGGYWRLTSPVEADADMDGITRMTRTLGDLSAAEILYVGETLSGRFSDAAQQIAATLTVEPTGEAGDDAGPRTVTLHVARLDDEEIAWIQRDGLWTVGRSENLWNLLSAELRQQEAAETDAPEADAGDPDAPAPFAPAPPMP
ncbi:MAG: DUF4340 domain-containing protein [Planctomycetes bacterium]|jgi:hypothetical protein|nr:DUF4340 domain-containing protein [Planctomycetota bacterium]